ncbi:MAG: hypothetical protein K2K57_02885 [Oscillospiraceae bacterium]|nr:hypothetical protein [Oscillospiraceae bacterium]
MYGIICFSMGVTLREGSREYFYKKLDEKFPGIKEKYIKNYGNNYYVDSPKNPELMRLFHQKCERAGIAHGNDEIFEYLYKFEEKDGQMSLWEI